MTYRFARFFAVSLALVVAGSAYARPPQYDFIDGSSVTQGAIAAEISFRELGETATEACVREFYEARGFRPAWSGDDEAMARLRAARSALEHADTQGLRPSKYTSGLERWRALPQPGQEAAEFDLAMTEAVIRYAMDGRTGQFTPKDVYDDASLPAQRFDAGQALADAVRDDSIEAFLASLPPRNQMYRQLVDALARYRAIAAQGGWPSVSRKDTEGLDKRLAFEDESLAGIGRPSAKQLRDALIRYQKRNGLDATGKLDADTMQALNVPASYRAEQIAANMERWRWLPRAFEDRYIIVNAGDQSLDYFEGGQSKLHSRVIVGKKETPTPIVRAEVQDVVANPPWDIPQDIAAKELLPHFKKDKKYPASRNLVVTGPNGEDANVDWKTVEAASFDYQVQQKPGPSNVLGKVMLDSPNEFGVYMHDTPNKKYFQADVRERSHGCVRVEKVLLLARLVMGDDGEDLADALKNPETTRLTVPDPVPVYMLYWTAIPQSDGTVAFRPDRYGRDAKLIAKLPGAGIAVSSGAM